MTDHKPQTIDLNGDGAFEGTKLDTEINRRLALARERLNGRLIAPHQTDGVRFLIKREIGAIIKGGILADEMGLGKTVQMISLILSEEDAKQPTLVVCNKSLLKQWESEIKRYAPQLHVWILDKKSMEQLGEFFLDAMGGNTVIVTSYGWLRGNSVCRKVMWGRIILDEAHHIKNNKTAVFKNACALQARSRWCITGTPITRNRRDMVSLFRFCRLYTNEDKGVSDEELRLSASTYLLRRTFDDLCKVNARLALPPLNIQTHAVDLKEEEKKMYNALIQKGQDALTIKEAPNLVVDSEEARKINADILAVLMQLQQCVVSPSIISKDARKSLFNEDPDCMEVADVSDTILSSKMHKLGDVMDEIGREKALIFTHWKAESRFIENICREKGVSVQAIHGGLSSEQRDEIVKTFQDSNAQNPIQVIIIQIDCGACGLNLTQAKHVVFPSLDWAPSKHMQAIARAHRIGQDYRVTVHYLVATGTIDEHVLSKQFAKLSEASMILDDDRIKTKMGDVVDKRCDVFHFLKLLNY